MSNLPQTEPERHSGGKLPPNAAQAKSRLVILVLGMHRSGTSATAGLISKLGVGLPDNLQPAQAENERGFFESTVIGQAHDKLLAANGAGWNSLDDLGGIGQGPAGRAFVAAMPFHATPSAP